ncbi:MAG: ampG3 [Alphaproteobacteria bacterium]|jgi:PAT family beta-lactamase induction signal transducer AmpG|nr:ampG3 [Alphaproteobacteria bacterium]
MTAPTITGKARKRYTFRDYLNPRVLVTLALGFSSGLPFLLVGNTFGFWLADEGTSLTAIGFISWVGLAYSLKFLWAPLLDRLDVPWLGRLGRRRGWMALAQVIIALGLVAMAASGTAHGLVQLGILALVVAFAAATQDIAIDAWRIEIARNADELGLLTSALTLGFRIALLCTDSLILVSAQHLGWPLSYTLCGALMAIGLAASFLAGEPARADAVMARNEIEKPLWTPRGFFDAVAGPFIAFFRTYGALALLMLVAISLYRLPDFMRGPVTNKFYHDIGLSKDVIGAVRGTLGLVSVFAGVAAGGFLSVRLGYMRALLVGGVLQAVGIAAFALLTVTGPDITAFTAVMCFDDFAISIAGVALVAYMSSLTSLGYTATQYALLSSAYALAGKFLKGFSGLAIDSMTPAIGRMHAYGVFFLACGAIGIPALLLFWLLERRKTAITAA